MNAAKTIGETADAQITDESKETEREARTDAGKTSGGVESGATRPENAPTNTVSVNRS